MAYCDIKKIRLISGLESEDIHDERLINIRDDVATPELNNDVNVDVKAEKVEEISGSKENNINGSNKTFWLRKPHKSFWHIGDHNDDAFVDGSDVDALYIDDDSRVDNLSVTIKDKEEGKIEVEESNGDAIPDTAELYLDYSAAPVDVESHPQVATACAQLTASYAYTKVEAGKLDDFSVGNITVNNRSEAMTELKSQYRETVQNLTQKQLIQSGSNVQTVANERVFEGE